ncbi:MAG: hypothetical protein MK108_16750, partial [Mariniblastus sp.]|nr:hypothetical protein [Mariniblastus sp.]
RFDPYLKWLGIRDDERPPNHYRLLGFDQYTPSRKTDPTGSPSVKQGRVFRGFSCVHTAVECRSSFRGGLDPKLRYASGGFRVVLPIPDQYFNPAAAEKNGDGAGSD